MSTASSSHVEACPDPSVHSRFSREQDLQNNASKAALLASESKTTSPSPEQKIDALGPDGRLSSAGAATSLKYAKAQDLPSFPSVGIETQRSGNTAANLANSNRKSPEYWKPDGTSSSASKAALLAAKDGGHLNLWQYKPDGTGNSAASMAMGKNTSPQLDYGYTEDGHRKALLAATMSTRKKATAPPPVISPPEYPDSANSGFNALNAASAAHKPTTYQAMSDKGLEASRITHATGISRDMYGSKPPVMLEEEEKKHQAALRAAAVSTAKTLYDIEKPHMEKIAAGDMGARRAHAEAYNAEPIKAQAMDYLKVQEAAQKLAAERLAKLDPDGVLAYKEHYGYGNPGTQKKSMSMRRSRRGRGSRDSKEDDDSSDDEVRAAKIKSQMAGLNKQVADVDTQKRSQDRKDLMAAAQKSVQARMSAMDERVFNDTGKMTPHMMEEWEAKARAKAAADSEDRMVNHGKVHIGGGRYMDQSEIDAIAAGRMQPTLDEISETAQLQRARDAEVRADQERRAEEARLEKERQANIKAQTKMIANDEKARVRAEKDAEKAEKQRVKDEQKAAAREQKDAGKTRIAEEKAQREQGKEADAEADRVPKDPLEQSYEQEAEREKESESAAAEVEKPAVERAAAAEAEGKKNSTEAASSDVAGDRTVTSTETDRPEPVLPVTGSSTKRESKIRGFFGRMRSRKEKDGGVAVVEPSNSDAEKYKSGAAPEGESAELAERSKGKERADSVSSISSEENTTRGRSSALSEDKWSEARDQFEEEPPRVSTGSPNRAGGSKFQEEL